MQYWKTHKKDLILSYFEKSMDHKSQITLWQQFGSSRVSYSGKFTKCERAGCVIQIKNTQKELESYKDDHPFFVHIPELDLIFKKENYTRMGQIFDFSLPTDIQVYEKRRAKRYTYQYQDHKDITFYSKEVDPSTGQPIFRHSCVLLDISTSGACMVCPSSLTDKLFPGQLIYLSNITDQKLPKPFQVKIVYNMPYSHKDNNLIKIGIVFDDELDSISYKSITSIIEIKQKKTQGLSQDYFCGLDEEEQTRILNQIESSNLILANNIKDAIEYLDRLRYMTSQMKIEFLQEVNHDVLAISLRLSHKELIYELLSEVTTTMQKEFLEKLQQQRPPSAISKAQDEILKYIKQQEATGKIILDPTAFITYV